MQNYEAHRLWGIILAGGEGTRVRKFLTQLCGGRGLKQFCAVIGRRSMLEHTLTRVERLIPRERILVVVDQQHYEEASQQLRHWPKENIIWQPTNRDTAPGLLLPLAHIGHRSPFATVAVFPSDHCIMQESRFMSFVEQAVRETQSFPRELTLLGVEPNNVEEGYGWIEPDAAETARETVAVRHFWEKPSLSEARALLRRNALWNTFVFTAQAATLWEMVRQTAIDLYEDFMYIRRALHMTDSRGVIENVYRTMRAVNFSSAICQPLPTRLRMLRVSEVGWSDWGSKERILDSLRQLGKLEECLARLCNRDLAPSLPSVPQRNAWAAPQVMQPVAITN